MTGRAELEEWGQHPYRLPAPGLGESRVLGGRVFVLVGPHKNCPRCGREGAKARTCEGRRAWFWGLLGPAACPLSRRHVHAGCPSCGLDWLEVTPEAPEPGGAR